MKKNIKDLLTVIIVSLCIVLGSSLSYAFVGPTAVPPGNNAVGPVNSSSTPQAKGGSTVFGSLFDINGVSSANNIFAWHNLAVNQNLTIGSLAGNGIRPVCVAPTTHKLVICTFSGPVCGNGIVEGNEDCDDGNTVNGDGCSSTCMLEGGGGGGGGGPGYGGFSHCFLADTQVTMADGFKKNIQDIKIGDILRGGTSNNIVLGFHRPTLDGGKVYSFNGGRYFVTEEHPFKTIDGWKSINPEKTATENIGITVTELKVGDTLVTDHGPIKLITIDSKNESEDTPLYNFKLSGDHTYYADGYLVHNKALCSGDGALGVCAGTSICIDNTPPPQGAFGIPPGFPDQGTCSLPCSTPDPNPSVYCAAHPGGNVCTGDYQFHNCL